MKKVLKISLIVLMIFVLVGCEKNKKEKEPELVYSGIFESNRNTSNVEVKVYSGSNKVRYAFETENIQANIKMNYNGKTFKLEQDKLKGKEYSVTTNLYEYNYVGFDSYNDGYTKFKVDGREAAKILTSDGVKVIIELDDYAQLEVIGLLEGYLTPNEVDLDKDFNDIINSITIETTKKY